MAFMTSNSMAEGSLATAFVMAIADLMDDGGNRDPSQKTKEGEKQEHQKRNESLECQKAAQQQIKTIGSKQPTTSYCSPYESLYWLGGDCIRETAHHSLSTINECATMKTDNTTEMNHTPTTTSPVSNNNNNNNESMHVAIVSPDKSSCSTASSTDSSRNEEHKHGEHEHEDNDYPNNDNVQNHDQNDAIHSNNDGNSNSKADSIISEYHNKCRAEGDSSGGDGNSKSNSKSLFDDYGDYLDYSDPMNSILVEDHNTDLETYRIKEEDLKKKIMRSYKTKTRSTASSIFCPGVQTTTITEIEEEDWVSKANASNSSLCGFYPSMLMYGDDDGNTPEEETSQKHPDYYAEFKPQRQYAFDEGDQVAGSAVSKTRNMLDGMSSTANSNDLNSVTSSVQSFMVIHRPHTSASATHLIPSTPLTEKLARNNSKHRSSSGGSGMITPVPHGLHNHHLHKLIASSAPGLTVSSPIPTPVPTDSESEGNPHRNHHNNDHDSLEEDNALTQSLMRKLQKHLPYGKRGDSFWLQYSLIRDGASLDSLLDMVHKDSNSTGIKSNSISSVLAIETVEGEVFGAFLTQTWRRSYNQWYGGGQSFLWTTAAPDSHGNSKSKRTGDSKNNTKIRVFPYSFKNNYVQLCDRDRLLVGGGDGGDNYEKHCYGFGLALEKDLLTGSSCPCTTFESPSLSKLHADGSTFEIRNVEVWTLTPCLTIIDNPSQGLVRVHKKDDRILQIPKPIPRHATTRNVEDEPDDGSSLSDCYSDCNLIDEDNMEDGRNLSTYTFPGAHESAVRNRNVRRTNRNN